MESEHVRKILSGDRPSPDKDFLLKDLLEIENNIIENDNLEYGTEFHKWIFYEFCPIIRICSQLEAYNPIIRFPERSQSYDGELIIEGLSKKLECVRAVDGHNEALTIELLKQKGNAPAFQKIKAIGTKNKRIFEGNEIEAIESSEHCLRFEQEIYEAFSLKNDQPKYKDCWLIISADNWFFPSARPDLHQLQMITCEHFWARPERNPSIFERVYVTGLCRNYDFIWQAPS
jgi:hypothetical protein